MRLPTAWEIRAAAGEPRAVIRVRNLQTTLGALAGSDAWGRTGRPQPALLSAEVMLAAPFSEAVDTDTVAADTVHYGTLSKAMLKSIAHWEQAPAGQTANGAEQATVPCSLRPVVDKLWADLGGHPGDTPSSAVLQPGVARYLSVSVRLPKASLAGDGVSMTMSGILGTPAATTNGEGARRSQYPSVPAVTLCLHGLRLRTLVGVHPHERTAKQTIVADVTLDGYGGNSDEYAGFEALVVRVCSYSIIDRRAWSKWNGLLMIRRSSKNPAMQHSRPWPQTLPEQCSVTFAPLTPGPGQTMCTWHWRSRWQCRLQTPPWSRCA